MDRFTAAAALEDVEADLELLGTEYLDLVYLDDNSEAPFEAVIEAIGRQIESGRVRAFGVRNWDGKRLHAAHAQLSRTSHAGVSAVVTTELALASATVPLWPEYLPFDGELRQAVDALSLSVFAHASDINLGLCLFGDEDATTYPR